MKRDENIQPLSRQHHDELLGCLLIKKGVRKEADIAVLTDFTNIFWKDDLKKHLQIEQDVLIPFLIRHKFEARYINILQTDHSILQSILERLNVYDRRHRVFEIFANLVEQHIRFKERFIFERMQEMVSEKELEQLGLQLQHTSKGKCTDYPVRFWE
jgi:hypothetical protein